MWQFQGTCSTPDNHDAEAGPRARTAREACDRCPVRAECLDTALRAESYGIWGGTNTAERKVMRANLGIIPTKISIDALLGV